ncbi:MAG: DUF4266 domain-containing protein [Vicinamibacterales bacterium]|nr:DUF4266 domain-containing protein [Vicinamibacterales bacterium]
MRPYMIAVVLLVGVAGSGCATVQSWERGTHALAPMQVEDPAAKLIERSIDVYREGAVGANGGKSGGGCGCS